MRYSDILIEYKTKNNRDITFEVIEDEEGDNNRGWLVDRINAYVDGMLAGYLKITYIPKERFKKHYTSIFYWADQILGKNLLPIDKKTTPWQSLTSKEKRKLLLYGWLEISSNLPSEKQKHIANLPEQDLDKEISDLENVYQKKYGKELRGFYEYYVDKPYEDFIRVFDIGDRINPRKSKEESGHNFLRQGIGLALYFRAVDFLKSKGLKLRLSGLRSKEGGEAIGEKIRSLGLTTPGKSFEYSKQTYTFDYLDPEKVDAYKAKNNLEENKKLRKAYTRDDWEDVIRKLLAQANAAGREPEERAAFLNKAAEIKARLDKEDEPKRFDSILPDSSKGEITKRYNKDGNFEPFPFKRGRKVDVRT